MERSALYRCGIEELWQRETGKSRPIRFARKIGGCEDLVKRLELYTSLYGHDGCVNTVHFNQSGDLLVSGSDDREIIIWDWAAKKQKLSYCSGHESNVFQARFMPFSDDRSVVTCAADGQVRHGQVWEDGRVETTKLAKHRGRAHKLAVEPGSPRIFFSCAEDGVVRHFDLRESKSTRLFTCTSFQGGKKSRRLNIVRLNSIVINPRNPNYFSVGGSDEYARIYDMRKVDVDAPSRGADFPVDTFAPKHLVGGKEVHITCIAYSMQEELLVSYNDELIYMFDKDMGMGPEPVPSTVEENGEVEADEKSPQVFKGHRNADTVKGVSYFGPNSEYVVSGSDCGWLFIWRKKDGKLVTMRKGDKQVVNCLEPHPFSTVLATSGIESLVKIWTPTAERRQSLPPNAEKVMDRNRKNREGPEPRKRVLMHVMRVPRRGLRDFDGPPSQTREIEDDDDDMDFLYSNMSDDDSSDEGSSHGNPRECIIS